MRRPLDQDVTRAAHGGPGARAQLQRMISRILRRHSLAARVLKGPDGQVTPAAADWLAQLARDNFVNGGGFSEDPLRLASNTARRELVLEIMNSVHLDVGRLNALTRMEREAPDE